MFKKLFIRKDLRSIYQQVEDNPLKKHLTLTHIVFLGIGAIIGAGIFVITGTAAALHAGPAISISFIISAFGCLLAGLAYAEFSSMIPISGSAYSYGYATLGEFVAWIIGWDLILEYLFGAATVAVGWSGYVVSFLTDFGISIPAEITQSPISYDTSGWHLTGAIINFPAVFIVAIMSTLLILGIKESTRINNIVVIIKVIVILLFIGFGISHINIENWVPFIPENTGVRTQFGWTGILTGAAVVFFAYIGFDAVSTTAQEAINPKRDIPRGILISLLITVILYVSVSLVMTGIVKYTELNVAAPIAVAINATGKSLAWLSPIIKIGAIAGLSSVVMVLLMAQSRIFYVMAKDGLLWKIFTKTHKKNQTPYVTNIIIGFFVALAAGVFPISLLGNLVSIGTLFAFIIVCIGIIVMRKTSPDAPRAFKTPWVPFIPILGIVVFLIQMLSLPKDTWWRLIIWMIIGCIIYFTYGIKHSIAQKKRKKEVK